MVFEIKIAQSIDKPELNPEWRKLRKDKKERYTSLEHTVAGYVDTRKIQSDLSKRQQTVRI